MSKEYKHTYYGMVRCGKCGKRFKIPGDNYCARGSPIYLCGDHGSIYIGTTCPSCKVYISVDVNEW